MKYALVEDRVWKLLGFTPQDDQEDLERITEFNSKTPEVRSRLIDPQLEMYKSALSDRSGFFPIAATISAALVALIGADSTLIILSNVEKISILSFFLFLIPATLHYYIHVKEIVANSAIDVISSYQGRIIRKVFEDNRTLVNTLNARLPDMILYCIWAITIFFIIKLWLPIIYAY